MARMSHLCRQWRLKPSASKTVSSAFHLHNTSATSEPSVYLDGQRLRHECHPTHLGVTRPYAVLQRTLDKDCRQAEKLKQLVNEASWFHLGRQRQHSAVICSGASLFSIAIQQQSTAPQSGDALLTQVRSMCNWFELYHAPHLWYPPFYTSPMASSALQHWTASPTKEGCHWQAGGENSLKHDKHGSRPIQPDIYNPPLLRHPGSRCGWTCNQLTSKVDGGITGSRLRWSILI